MLDKIRRMLSGWRWRRVMLSWPKPMRLRQACQRLLEDPERQGWRRIGTYEPGGAESALAGVLNDRQSFFILTASGSYRFAGNDGVLWELHRRVRPLEGNDVLSAYATVARVQAERIHTPVRIAMRLRWTEGRRDTPGSYVPTDIKLNFSSTNELIRQLQIELQYGGSDNNFIVSHPKALIPAAWVGLLYPGVNVRGSTVQQRITACFMANLPNIW